MLINGVLKNGGKQRHGNSDAEVKCKDKNMPENVKTLEKHSGICRWQHLKLQMECIR